MLLIDVAPVSIIIPARNEGQRLSQTILSIIRGRSCIFPLEIVVVDDGSSDGCCHGLSQLVEQMPFTTLVLKTLGDWYGIPYARNRGMETASNNICFITDANTVFAAGWDTPIWQSFDRRRLFAGTIADLASSFRGYGCTLLLPAMAVNWLTQPGLFGGYVPVTACSCTVVDRSLFYQLGGYDESLPLYGSAEPEFSVRAWLSGYEIVNVPDLVIHHWFKPRQKYEGFRRSIRDILLRNSMRFACYYLAEELLLSTYDHYAEDLRDRPDLSLAAFKRSEAWVRREHLRKNLPRDFDWFAHRFTLIRDGTAAA